MKKSISLFLIVCLLCTALCGCRGGSEADGVPTAADAGSTTSPDDSPEDLVPTQTWPTGGDSLEPGAVPEGYNEHDYHKLADFLAQPDQHGKTNGTKLSSTYTPYNIFPAIQALGVSWNTQENGELRLASINCSFPDEGSASLRLAGILDLSGCTALRQLNISARFSGLCVDGCTALESVSCNQNTTEELVIRGCPALKTLFCGQCTMQALLIADCPALEEVQVSFGALQAFRMEGCPAVRSLYHIQNGLRELDVRGSESLNKLILHGHGVTQLDLSGFPQLTELNVQGSGLQTLDLSPCPQLSILMLEDDALKRLDLSPCGELTNLYCGSLGITELDLSPCEKLRRLSLYDDGALSRVDLSAAGELVWAELSNLPITELDLSACKNLTILKILSSGLTDLDLSPCLMLRDLEISGSGITELALSDLDLLRSVRVAGCPLKTLDFTGCKQFGFRGVWAEGNGTVSWFQVSASGSVGNVYAVASPGEGGAFLGWRDWQDKPLAAELREKETIRLEIGDLCDGLVAVFEP